MNAEQLVQWLTERSALNKEESEQADDAFSRGLLAGYAGAYDVAAGLVANIVAQNAAQNGLTPEQMRRNATRRF